MPKPSEPSATDAAPLMLSVSGMRGLVGRSITPDAVARFAAAFAGWGLHEGGWPGASSANAAPIVVVGRDSRPSGEAFELAAAAGLAAAGCRVVRLGVASTPGVAVMARHLGAAGGLVVTASHNPAPWNGIKTLTTAGGLAIAPPPDQARRIIERFQSGDIPYVGVEHLHRIEQNGQAPRVHAEAILPHIDVRAIREARLKVVVDSVHGAGGAETMHLLHELGVRCVHLYAQPTGGFPHPPEPTREHLAGLSADAVTHGAAIAFAQDPDADRLAILDEAGRYVGEEYTLALCAHHLLKKGGVAAANLSTSRMIDDVAGRVGATVVRTPVGEANVAAAIEARGAALGGEGNGGIIWPRVTLVRDSLVGIAVLLEMLARRGRPLSEIVAELPAYAIVKDKLPFDADLADQLVARMRRHFGDQKLDVQDGVRADWPGAWVHVRPSNTEPILRIIAEAPDEAAARGLVSRVRAAVTGG